MDDRLYVGDVWKRNDTGRPSDRLWEQWKVRITKVSESLVRFKVIEYDQKRVDGLQSFLSIDEFLEWYDKNG